MSREELKNASRSLAEDVADWTYFEKHELKIENQNEKNANNLKTKMKRKRRDKC